MVCGVYIHTHMWLCALRELTYKVTSTWEILDLSQYLAVLRVDLSQPPVSQELVNFNFKSDELWETIGENKRDGKAGEEQGYLKNKVT